MKYVIIRQVTNGDRDVQLPKEIDVTKIQRVYLLLNEELFHKLGPVHHRSVFIEDKFHDWYVRKGKFQYYAHSGAPGDVVDIVLEIE